MTNKPYSNLKCPNCGEIGDYEKDSNEEVYCNHCGLIIKSPYPYSAGIRFNTLTQILDEEKMENMKNNLWRKYYAEL